MFKTVLLPFVLMFSFSTVFSQLTTEQIPADMPVHKAAYGFNAEMRYDSELEFLLQAEINKRPQWKKLVANKKMSVGLVDISDEYNPTYASLNGDHMMYAASLPKIAVLLAAMDAIEKGELADTKTVRDDLWLMISKSNNQATTRTIDRVGFDKIASIVQDPAYHLYDRNSGGGLWVGKRYAAQGNRLPDPLKGLSHAASVNSVLTFYQKMAYGQLVSPEKSKEMLQIMMNPSLHHKFVNTLDRVNPEAKVFRKSGSWKQFHSDSAIVWGKDGRKYILVALIEDNNGGTICKNLVTSAEKIISQRRPIIALN